MTTLAQTTSARDAGMTKEEKFVIFASSLGTVFEWYDFYLYATLAPFFASLFFPPGNDTAALLSAFATYAAGFLVRPFGALLFGRIGDLVGRKYTFLVTILVMGSSTFLVGLLPTRNVELPMTRMVTRKVYLRPTRSPIRPNSRAPNGRTRKPAA